MATSSNLVTATRELIDRTWRSAVAYGMPLFTRLLERKQVLPGGEPFEQIYQSADLQSLVQEYGPNDGLNGGAKDVMEKPHWHRAYLQCPVEESVDERIMNAPKTDAQLIKIRDKIAKEAVKAIKIQMAMRTYGCATDTEIDASHTYFQGLVSALLENTTYAGIARTASAYPEWQSADEDNWDTATVLNKENLDAWLDAVGEYMEEPGDILILLGATLWRRLKSIFEASNCYEPKANMAAQGFESMTYNGVEIAKDQLLDRMTQNGQTSNQGSHSLLHNGAKTVGDQSSSTVAGLAGVATSDAGATISSGATWGFVLNLKTWHIRYAPDREGNNGPFGMSEFTRQDIMEGGQEKWLARVKFKGNLTCDMPNQNLMRANLS